MTELPSPPDDRATLAALEQIRAGDDAGWNALYERYHDELLLVIRRRLGERLRSKLGSEDVLQSVALEAFRALPTFEDRGEGSLRRFLHTLVLNKIRDKADVWNAAKRDPGRERGDSVLASVPARGSGPPTYFDDAYLRLEAALARLPDAQREVVWLRRVEGWSSKEVAARTGRTDDAVRKVYSRALARLCALMGAAEDDRGGSG